MNTKTIQQKFTFKAQALQIYSLLMDENKHAAFTNSNVKISNKEGGKFTVFDGYCHGYNIELIKGKRIVQAWHFEEEGWPENHFSICTFQFEEENQNTKLTFTQSGVPEHKVEALKQGWKDFYWNPIKRVLKNKH